MQLFSEKINKSKGLKMTKVTYQIHFNFFLDIEKTKKGGAQIVELLKDGSAYYAPAKATALMVEAILSDKKQIYPCAVMLNGEYGYKDVVSGVPVMLGANGAEKIIEANLNDEQDRQFAKSIGSVRQLIDTLNKNNFFNISKTSF